MINLLKILKDTGPFKGRYFPWIFFKKMVLIQTIFTLLAMVTTAYLSRFYLKKYLITQAEIQLDESLRLIEASLARSPIPPLKWCDSLKILSKTRYTLIDAQGGVICDNLSDPFEMDNHHERPEIQKALRTGKGFALRTSKTLNLPMLYGAMTLREEGHDASPLVLRLAIPLEKLGSAIMKIDGPILVFLFPFVAVIIIFSLWTSARLTYPLRALLEKIDGMKSLPRPKFKAFQDDSRPYSPSAQGNLISSDLPESSHSPNFPNSPNSPNSNDEWSVVENALEQTQRRLESSIEDLFLENQKISALLESISESILAIDNKLRPLFVNDHFRETFLSKGRETLLDPKISIRDIIKDPELCQFFEESLIDSKKKGIRSWSLITQGSKKQFFDITITPLKDTHDKIFGVVGVFQNVTERRLTEQMREDFVANVSHEVRTPLTAIKGYVQLLKATSTRAFQQFLPQIDKHLGQQLDDYFEKIEINTERLTTLFNDILNLSLIESQGEISVESVSTRDLSSIVIDNLKQVHSAKNIEIELLTDAPFVEGDPILLEQVLNNLLDNAIKYSAAQGKIIIAWEPCDQGVKLKVKDHGPGIHAKHLPRLFERFYRADPSRSRELGGTGLGLSIVKHIVQKHKGHIEVESEIDQGTQFTLTFPHKN